ncbi:tetratricopeptide repeat protein [Gemmatimonas sp.]|uniref:tetratricopeptide repeat protein n=1 Tax=Gemmatimonas sp. TaxID=1962908 RepID=UPI00356B1286
MAQSSRSASSSSSLSDDPMEKLGDWFQSNSRPIGMAVGGLAVAALAIFGYRSYSSGQNSKASTALYAAQAPMAQGNFAEAAKTLEKVAKGYSGTASGQQAALLLSQALYEQKKYAEGIAALEKAVGGASADFKASMESMIAVGYELQGKLADAAAHYAKASTAAKFENDKNNYKAFEARSLMAAGKSAEAKKIWEELAKSDSPVAQEANVRLGELAGAGKK